MKKKKELEIDKNAQTHYSKKLVSTIQIIYIVAVVIWILLIYALGVFAFPLGWTQIILAVPVVIYAIGFLQVCNCNKEVEADMFSGDFVAIGLLFITLFVHWTNKINSEDSRHTVYVILAAFTLIMFSIIDVWISKKSISILKHIRSIFQTGGIILLIYVLYFHFSNIMGNDSYRNNSPSVDGQINLNGDTSSPTKADKFETIYPYNIM